MAERGPLSQRSPLLRWLAPLVRTRAAAGTTLAFLALAAAGFLGTRAGLVAVRYASMNPVRDPVLWQRIGEGTATKEEWANHRALGSSLAAETLYLPPPVVLGVISLGNPSAVADLLFVRAHAYFLSHFFGDRRFEWLDAYVDTITALDPDNPRVYLWAAQVVKLGQSVDREVIEHSNRFLQAGLQRFPRDWRLHMDLGYNLNFELTGLSEEEKALSRLKARDHFVIAAGIPGAPIDPNFVAEIFENQGRGTLGITLALQKYYEATPEQRTLLLRRIRHLSKALAEGLEQEEQRRRERWPFLPTPLFSLIDDQGRMAERLRAGYEQGHALGEEE
jgi:hypothetical protein